MEGSTRCSYATLAIAVACIASAYGDESCQVTLEINTGMIRGLKRETNRVAYYSFRNVTYAQQPVQELRFQELKPAKPWEGELDATENGPICPQKNVFYKTLMTPNGMKEECIHANVYVPANAPIKIAKYGPCRTARELRPPYVVTVPPEDSSRGLPIFVFIHGGGFAFGSGDPDLHGPEFLVSKGVIVVTFNYRISALGFLSLNTSSVPGNAGLRDMITLLKWVRTNAAAFGGDPDSITVGGQSAGAGAAHLLSLSPAAKGLFKRIIAMSGSAFSFFTPSPLNAARLAKDFLQLMNITKTDPNAIYDCLINAPVEKINEAANYILDQQGIMDFVPVIESQHKGVIPILPDDVDELVKIENGTGVPKIIGFAENECLSFQSRFEEINILDVIITYPLILIPQNLLLKLPDNDTILTVHSDIMKTYFKNGITMDDYIRYCSDVYFIYPALKAARSGGNNVYLYKYSYRGAASEILQDAGLYSCKNTTLCSGGAHVEDLLYVFNARSNQHVRYSNEDENMRDAFTTLFTNFMRYGDPTSDPSVALPQWEPVRPDRLQYLDIKDPSSLQMQVIDGQLEEMKIFFDSLYNIVQD